MFEWVWSCKGTKLFPQNNYHDLQNYCSSNFLLYTDTGMAYLEGNVYLLRYLMLQLITGPSRILHIRSPL